MSAAAPPGAFFAGLKAPALRPVLAVAALYAAAALAFWPRAILVSDESYYVRAALAFAQGSATVPRLDVLTGDAVREPPSPYPPGTSALQAPFVKAFGWRGAFVPSVASACGATVLLGLWLLAEGLSPLFALLLLGFPPTLVLGRVAMSDVPAALVCTAAFALLFRAAGRAPLLFAAGLLAGGALLLRETTEVALVPFLALALLRRERGAGWLLLGFALGLSARPLAALAAFGDPLFVKDQGSGWSWAALRANLGVHLASVLLLAPGGLLAALLYRGPRAAEVRLSAAGFSAFLAAYWYGAEQSGGLKQLVLYPRLFLPVVPLYCLGLASAWQRLQAAAAAAPGAGLPRLVRGLRAAGFAWACGVALAAAAVHPALARYGRDLAALSEAIAAATPEGSALVIDPVVADKLVGPPYGERAWTTFQDFPAQDLPRAVARAGAVFLVRVERGGAFHRERLLRVDRWLSEAGRRCRLEPVREGRFGEQGLTVLRARECPPAP